MAKTEICYNCNIDITLKDYEKIRTPFIIAITRN